MAVRFVVFSLILALSSMAGPSQAPAQATPAEPPAAAPPQQRPTSAAPRGRAAVPIDEERARRLYVSNRPEDHAIDYDFEADIRSRQQAEARYAEASTGVMDFRKISYRSSVGDMEIPAYLFQPLKKRGLAGHAAMVWVHGGVHGNWG